MPRPLRAFTLVEVLITLLILAVVATLAVPMFGQTQTTRLKAAATLLVADLDFARVESIAHSDDLRLLILDPPNRRYYLARAAAPDTPLTNPATRQPYEVTFGQGRAATLTGVSIQSYSLGGDARLQFGMYGQLDQAVPATITLAAEGRALTITIDPVSGEASIGQVQ